MESIRVLLSTAKLHFSIEDQSTPIGDFVKRTQNKHQTRFVAAVPNRLAELIVETAGPTKGYYYENIVH